MLYIAIGRFGTKSPFLLYLSFVFDECKPDVLYLGHAEILYIIYIVRP